MLIGVALEIHLPMRDVPLRRSLEPAPAPAAGHTGRMITLVASVSSPGSNTVAIVAIVAGAVVGLVGSGVAVWTIRTQHAFLRGEADRDELKAILDVIVENIYCAQTTIFVLCELTRSAAQDDDPRPRWSGRAQKLRLSLVENRLTLLSELNRLGLRLGALADPMVDEVAEATNIIDRTVGLWDEYDDSPPTAEELEPLHALIQDCRINFSRHALEFTRAKLKP